MRFPPHSLFSVAALAATELPQDRHDTLAPVPDLDGPTVGGVIEEVRWSARAEAVGITALSRW
ncbi:hypothetical protein [Streptacidiphilus sp. PAMC 29251]